MTISRWKLFDFIWGKNSYDYKEWSYYDMEELDINKDEDYIKD